MADKTYKLNFTLSDGTTQSVQFTAPQGETGATGATGAAGTSVAVSNVSESTADGGSNVVKFSDGKPLQSKTAARVVPEQKAIPELLGLRAWALPTSLLQRCKQWQIRPIGCISH